jgi:cystathionine beta-lyase
MTLSPISSKPSPIDFPGKDMIFMHYDFDEIIDRKNTNSLKYDFAIERGKPEDVQPFWVADMDFRTPQKVIDALVTGSRHGVFGYSDVKEDYFAALARWLNTSFHWKVHPEWLLRTPGVVFAIVTAIRAFTQPGDAVIIQRPVYYPFSLSIKQNARKLINSPLINNNGHYEMDFADFEQKIIDHDVKLFILCSPHNPVGRVWTKEELTRIGDICLRHQVRIVADEIHQEFTFAGHEHTVFASLKKEFADCTITCTAPSKTFNLAGLQISHIFITNEQMRRRFRKEFLSTGYCESNSLGLIAAQSAYTYGREWLNQLKTYLSGNLDVLRESLQNIDGIQLVEPEGTYLAWLDCRGLGLTHEELDNQLLQKSRLWLDSGTMFGPEGSGFQRINIACPRKNLQQAIEKLKIIVPST